MQDSLTSALKLSRHRQACNSVTGHLLSVCEALGFIPRHGGEE